MKNAESFLAEELDLKKLTTGQRNGIIAAIKKCAEAYVGTSLDVDDMNSDICGEFVVGQLSCSEIDGLTRLQLIGTYNAMRKYTVYCIGELVAPGEPKSNLTPDILFIATKSVGLDISKSNIEAIVDLVHLIESKGDDASLMDIAKLKTKWRDE